MLVICLLPPEQLSTLHTLSHVLLTQSCEVALLLLKVSSLDIDVTKGILT